MRVHVDQVDDIRAGVRQCTSVRPWCVSIGVNEYDALTTRVLCAFALRWICIMRLGGLDVDATSFLPLPLKNIFDCSTYDWDRDEINSDSGEDIARQKKKKLDAALGCSKHCF